MALTTPMEMKPTSLVARMLRTCTTQQNVRQCLFIWWSERWHYAHTAKKEDNPEEALKEFKAIVDQEEEKGDW